MLEHDDDIICLSVDPKGLYAATGQIGEKPWICVWNTETLEVMARYNAPLTKGIKNIKFSPNGERIVASAMDDNHTIAVFDWFKDSQDGKFRKPIATGKGPQETIWSIGFNSKGDELVATTSKNVYFYSNFESGVIKPELAKWPGGKPMPTISHCYLKNVLYTGTYDGKVCVWTGGREILDTASNIKQCHEGPVYCMYGRAN